MSCAILGALALSALSEAWGHSDLPVHASPAGKIPGATGDRMATAVASSFRAYSSRVSPLPEITTWVQIDLGASVPIDAVRLYPFSRPAGMPGRGFPVRFRIDCSDDPGFTPRQAIVQFTKDDYPDPGDQIVEFPAKAVAARYVRVTVFRLREQKAIDPAMQLDREILERFDTLTQGRYIFSLSKIEVISEARDLALQRPVSVDAAYGSEEDAQQLTRLPRPQGEALITDNPQNIIPAEDWRPVRSRVLIPRSGVRLRSGLFRSTMEENVQYLLASYSLNDLLYEFRRRAGKDVAPPDKQATFWDDALAGSGAGRFLMGAGNAVRWMQHDELRKRMDALVDGIAECRGSDGYIMAYDKSTIFYSERGAYTRAWVTHGLIEAGYAGNNTAFDLLRGYYDWYNKQSFLPQVLRGCGFGPQGTVANTRLYFTPVGKAKDLAVVQQYLQENYFLEALSERDPNCIWQYPYDRPHCYIITFLESYLDLYKATGYRKYLEAVLGGWDLFRDNWQYAGGSFSISEGTDAPPKSNALYYRKPGELCGNAFWIALNQRLHEIYPNEEKYVAEIEKSIYNVILANVTREGVRYHTRLLGSKELPKCVNTCCEGQGSRIAGSLPEYIYTLADDGLYVNLFEASSIDFSHAGQKIRVAIETRFPIDGKVAVSVEVSNSVRMKIRIRVPCWARGPVRFDVNGKDRWTSVPATYATLDRMWKSGDLITFDLPIEFSLTEYAGVNQIVGHKRYSLEYGPILMAALGTGEEGFEIKGSSRAADLLTQLKRESADSLKFTVPLTPVTWKPYYEVDAESFTCFPIIDCLPDVNVM